MKLFTLSNIWQEIFEAFAKGGTAFQIWGIVGGILVFFLFILKPILRSLEDKQGIPNDQITTNLTKFVNSINKLKERIKCNKNSSLQELYGFKYKQNKSLLYFTNCDLRPDHLEAFFNYLFKNKMTSGYIICNKTELDFAIFNQVLELKSTFFEKRNLKNNSIHIFSEQLFKYEILINFPITEIIYFWQIGEIVDSKNDSEL